MMPSSNKVFELIHHLTSKKITPRNEAASNKVRPETYWITYGITKLRYWFLCMILRCLR
jgi:hypothetical protein